MFVTCDTGATVTALLPPLDFAQLKPTRQLLQPFNSAAIQQEHLTRCSNVPTRFARRQDKGEEGAKGTKYAVHLAFNELTVLLKLSILSLEGHSRLKHSVTQLSMSPACLARIQVLGCREKRLLGGRTRQIRLRFSSIRLGCTFRLSASPSPRHRSDPSSALSVLETDARLSSLLETPLISQNLHSRASYKGRCMPSRSRT